jgi:hypothetical protein
LFWSSMVSIEQTFEEAQKNDRICPQPLKWYELYEHLPNKKRIGAGWDPPLPHILAEWIETTAELKVLRLREHINWASAQGCLDDILSFLKNLKEDEWYHVGE